MEHLYHPRRKKQSLKILQRFHSTLMNLKTNHWLHALYRLTYDFLSTADYRELVRIHPHLIAEDVSVVVVVEVMMVLALVVHCLMLLVLYI
jgi:hypothetical protein